MRVSIRKWGRSLALRIPNAVAREALLREGKVVDILIERGRIIIAPVGLLPRSSLEELVAGITEDNRHEEVYVGRPVGRESL